MTFKCRSTNDKGKEQLIDHVTTHMFDPNTKENDFGSKVIDLRNPDEFITRIEGWESRCITKLIFTTNLGHKLQVGNEYPAPASADDDVIQFGNGPKPKYF